MENEQATAYLSRLLGKTLRMHISDGRMFVGQLKCTDKVMDMIHMAPIKADGRGQDMNLILSNAHEYREPSSAALHHAVEKIDTSQTRVVANMSSRFVGLIVVPGKHVRKVELEEFDPSGIA